MKTILLIFIFIPVMIVLLPATLLGGLASIFYTGVTAGWGLAGRYLEALLRPEK